MKKLALFFVILGALWAGSTAYISHQTPSALEAYLVKINKVYEIYGMKIKLIDYQKGFLASSAKVELSMTNSALAEQVKEVLNLPMQTVYKIAHGPIFLKNGFGVGISKISNELNYTEMFAEKIIKSFKNDLILKGEMTIPFFQDAYYTASTNALDIETDKQVKIHIEPLQMQGTMNIETWKSKATAYLSQIKIEKAQSPMIKLEDIVMNFDLKKFFDNGFYLMDMDSQIKKINMSSDNASFQLKNAMASLDMVIDQNIDESISVKFNIGIDLKESKLPARMPQIKKAKLGINIGGMEMEGLMKTQNLGQKIQAVEAKQKSIFKRIKTAQTTEERRTAIKDLQAIQNELIHTMAEVYAGILIKNKTTLSYSIDVTEQNNKQSKVSITTTYVGDDLPSTGEAIVNKFKKEIFDLLTLKVDIQLEESLLTEISRSEKKKLKMMIQQGFVKQDNGRYILDAQYKSQTLTINDKDFSQILKPIMQQLNQ